MNVYIVTGGSSGIGYAIAEHIAEGKVIITGRNAERLENSYQTLKEAGVDVHKFQGDISDQKSVAALFEYASSLGEIVGVINSAGVSGVGAKAEDVFKIDLLGSEIVIKEALKYATAKMSVILISSMMGSVVNVTQEQADILINPSQKGNCDAFVQLVGSDSNIAYNFSKKGVILLAEKWASEFGRKGARINAISPGVILTAMSRAALEHYPEVMEQQRMATPLLRYGEPAEIAYYVNFLLSDQAKYITGTNLSIDGGLSINLKKLM